MDQKWSRPTRLSALSILTTIASCSSSISTAPCTSGAALPEPSRYALSPSPSLFYNVTFLRSDLTISLNNFAQSHPIVTKSRSAKFQEWHFKWASKNVVDAQHRLCQDWLMGRYENLVPHRTRLVTDNDLARTPYRQYNRYCVDRLQQSVDPQQSQSQQTQTKDSNSQAGH